MKKYRALIILLVAVLVNVIETIYFGCNATALTPAETVWDGLCAAGMWIGIFLCAHDWTDYFWSHVSKVQVKAEEASQDDGV